MTSFNQFRTPVESSLRDLHRDHQDVVLKIGFERLKKREEDKGALFCYHMSEQAKEFLSTRGVYLSPILNLEHPHPISKTLENHFLYSVFGGCVNEMGEEFKTTICFVSLKPSKFVRFKRLMNIKEAELVNRVYACKDTLRYCKPADGGKAWNFGVGQELSSFPSERKKFFFHDELHHWKFKDLYNFSESTGFEHLWATIVYPVELLKDVEGSCNPLCYDFKVVGSGKKILFAPDGQWSEAYEQRKNLRWLFECRGFENSKGDAYSVEVMSSIAAHHMIYIRKGRSFGSSSRFFSDFDALDLSNFNEFNSAHVIRGVRFSTFKKIAVYLLSLKKGDKNSAVAKLRQMSDHVDMREVLFIHAFAELFSECGLDNLFEVSIWNRFKKWFEGLFPDWFQRIFSKGYTMRQLLKALVETSEFSVEIKTRFYHDSPFSKAVEVDLSGLPQQKRKDFLGQGVLYKLAPRFELRTFEPSYEVEEIFRKCRVHRKTKTPVWVRQTNVFQEVTILPPSLEVMQIAWVDGWKSSGKVAGLCPDLGPPVILKDLSFDSEFLLLDRSCDPVIERFVSSLNWDDARRHKGRMAKFFSENFSYGFNNTIYPSSGWPNVLEKRYGERFNSCLIQKYERGAFIGFHRDDEPCYDEGHEVLTVNLFGSAVFRVKDVHGKVTEFDLKHGDTLLMKSGFQERYKHSVVSGSPGRVSLTFRLQSRTMDGKPIHHYKKNNLFEIAEDAIAQRLEAMRRPPELPITEKEDGVINNLEKLVAKEMESVLIEQTREEVNHGLEVFADVVLKSTVEENNKILDELELLLDNSSVSSWQPKVELKMMENEVPKKFNLGCASGTASVKSSSSTDPSTGSTSSSSLDEEVLLQDLSGEFKESDKDVDAWITGVSNKAIDLKNSCFIEALSSSTGVSIDLILNKLSQKSRRLVDVIRLDEGLTQDECVELLHALETTVQVDNEGKIEMWGPVNSKHFTKRLVLKDFHFECVDMDGYKPSLSGKFKRTFHSDLLTQTHYTIRKEAVVDLVDSFLQKTSGVVLDSTFKDGHVFLQSIRDRVTAQDSGAIDVPVDLIYGFPGCGKTAPLERFVKDFRGNSMVVSPRRNLLNAWMRSGTVHRNKLYCTYELALKKNFSRLDLLIIDEVGLYPEGYLDLILMKLNMENKGFKCQVIIVGDPLQARYFNKDDRELIERHGYIPIKAGMNYANYTYRCGKWIEKILPVRSFNHVDKGEINRVESLTDSQVILVASRSQKISLAERFPEKRVMTYSESQGLTFDDATIVLSNEASISSNGQVLVAMTRTRRAPSYYLWDVIDEFNFVAKLPKNSLWKNFLNKEIVNDPIMELGMDFNLVNKPKRMGKKELSPEDKLTGDPWLKSAIFLGAEPEEEDFELIEVEVIEPKIKTHLPIASYLSAVIEVNRMFDETPVDYRGNGVRNLVRPRIATEHRELKDPETELLSTQFECRKVRFENVEGYGYSKPMNFESVYPRHNADDSVTFYAAVKKRLRFSSERRERNRLADAQREVGPKIFNEFTKQINIDPTFNQKDFDDSLKDFEEKRRMKSAELIASHAERSDPDWPVNFARIFMKSQLCTKFDNRLVDAKAGQTLACFSHSVLLRFGPWCRYAEKKILQGMPKRFYIHSRKNFNQLNEWVTENLRGRPVCVESDYTAFDSSQDANILAFELMLLERVGWPKDLIEDYTNLKCCLGSKLGNFAIMRFTGEFGTFLFNTLANMAFTFMKYHVNDVPICFAGDDMCAFGPLQERKDCEPILNKLKLKAKVVYTPFPTFCGWCLTSQGIYKQPRLILERLLCAMERGKLKDVIDSYAIEMSYGYSLGDMAFEVMDENQIEAHQQAARLFAKYKYMMKGESVKLLTDLQQ